MRWRQVCRRSALRAVAGAGMATVLALGCRAARPVDSPELTAPLPPPGVGSAGCVESEELHAYVLALAADRRASSDAALAALGAQREVRPGVFLEGAPLPALDTLVDAGGKRLAVVAHQALGSEPLPTLAKRGNSLHRIDERPRRHGAPVLVCGVTPCPQPQGAARATVRAVGVELAPDEALGSALVVAYDYWWAQVSYPKRAKCAPQVTAQ